MNIPNTYPPFTGRNVPLEEIAAATGLPLEDIQKAVQDGDFEFAVFLGNKKENHIYCSDKKVWEEIGYFRSETE